MILLDKFCKRCKIIIKDVDKDVFIKCKKCNCEMVIYYGNFKLGNTKIFIPSIARKKRKKVLLKDSKGNFIEE